jgi:hypothetical protein
MKPVGILALVLIVSLCVGGNGQPTETPEPTETQEPTYTAPPTTTLPQTTQPPTTPVPIDEELKWGQENGLSEEATNYMRYLDTDTEISDNEKYMGRTFNELYKEKGIPPFTTKEILNIVYKGGIDYLEYFKEKVIDSNVFNEMVRDNEFELYEKDLFGRMVETENPFIISQFNKNPEKKLPVYKGIFDKANNPTTEAEEIFFTNLHKKMFDKYNGSHLGHFRNDGNWYLTNLVSIGEDGKVYLLYSGEMLKNDDQLDKWYKELDPLYNEYGSPETNMDNHFKTWAEGDNLKKENLIGKDLDLPFNLMKYEVDLRIYEDNDKENRWDVYSEHFALGIPEIENTGRYELYEFCVPYNPEDTIICAEIGKVSNIDSYIYIYRSVGGILDNWGNLVFKDNEYIPVIKQPMASMEYKWKALLAILLGVQYTPEMNETGEKIKYTIID